MVYIPKYLEKVRESTITEQELIDFETEVKESYDSGEIRAPIHLSKGNERQLIEIFQYVHKDDWVFSSWRNHYHALLHGFDPEELFNLIKEGNSMGINSVERRFLLFFYCWWDYSDCPRSCSINKVKKTDK